MEDNPMSEYKCPKCAKEFKCESVEKCVFCGYCGSWFHTELKQGVREITSEWTTAEYRELPTMD